MRKLTDKHGLSLRVGDLLCSKDYPDNPIAKVYSIDRKKKVVRLVRAMSKHRYGFTTFFGQQMILSNTWTMSFRCMNRSKWHRYLRTPAVKNFGREAMKGTSSKAA